MIKFTVLYNHPANPNHFESYYAETHLPLAARIKGCEKVEYTKFSSGPNDEPAAFYRMAELWFRDIQAMQAAMGSPEGHATANDLANFATGGLKMLTGVVEN